MQQPKMIVLGLISQGWNYGLEMRKFIEDSNMRRWAQIGASTVYKTLRELEVDSCVSARQETAKRGPGKTVYDITTKGRKTFDTLVGEALDSDSSVYSDRIAGMVLALFLPKDKAKEKITTSIALLEDTLNIIQMDKDKHSNASAKIVLEYYHDIYAAEKKALEKALSLIKK